MSTGLEGEHELLAASHPPGQAPQTMQLRAHSVAVAATELSTMYILGGLCAYRADGGLSCMNRHALPDQSTVHLHTHSMRAKELAGPQEAVEGCSDAGA